MDILHHYLIASYHSHLGRSGLVTIDRESYDGPPHDNNSVRMLYHYPEDARTAGAITSPSSSPC